MNVATAVPGRKDLLTIMRPFWGKG